MALKNRSVRKFFEVDAGKKGSKSVLNLLMRVLVALAQRIETPNT